MKIIKMGEKPKFTKKFTCATCHTIFEADNEEYNVTKDHRDGGMVYLVRCPICGDYCQIIEY